MTLAPPPKYATLRPSDEKLGFEPTGLPVLGATNGRNPRPSGLIVSSSPFPLALRTARRPLACGRASPAQSANEGARATSARGASAPAAGTATVTVAARAA